MSIIFKEIPVNINESENIIIICENVTYKIDNILNVAKQYIIFSCIINYTLNDIPKTKSQIFTAPHDMIGGNVYQQCYEYLKKQLNVCGYSNI